MSTPAATKQAAATTALTPFQKGYTEIAADMRADLNRLQRLIPSSCEMKADQLMMACLNSLRKTPKLAECSKDSWFRAITNCASIGQLPDTQLQHCHLIPFNGQVVWVPGYRGLIDLLVRSGVCRGVACGAVYKDEVDSGRFKYWTDESGRHLVHNLDLTIQRDDVNDFVGVYVIFLPRDTGQAGQPYYMTAKAIDRIRDRSAAWKYKGQESPWGTDRVPMALKTVIKQGVKEVRVSADVMRAVELDNDAEAGDQGKKPIDITTFGEEPPAGAQPVVTTKTDAVAQKLKEKAGKSKPGTTEASGVTTAEASHTPTDPPPQITYASPSDWDKCIAYGDTAGLGESGCVEELKRVFHHSPNEIPLEFLPQVTKHFRQLAEAAQEAGN